MMAKAIEQLKSGLIAGHFAFGMHGDGRGSIRQQVHDGDTINVSAIGNFGVRFLGVDAPEISFTLPESSQFLVISNPKWETFLADPFNAHYPSLTLDAGLKDHLTQHTGTGTAANHYHHAQAAERELEKAVQQDMSELDQDTETFQFFLAFAGDIMDRYGRLLAYINRYQQNAEDRPLDYNGRLLQSGHVTPYFIFPNINPFRKQASIMESVPAPRTANQLANSEKALRQAREWVQTARTGGFGVFEPANPLQLQPFELRFLAQRRPPNRWVIDLSKNDEALIPPQQYYTIPNPEDRLYIPEEYVPLFVEKGWRRRT